MKKHREQTTEDMLQLLRQLADDREYIGEIRHGGRVAVRNFPVMFPPLLDGDIVGGLIQSRQPRRDCEPATLYGRLKGLPGFTPRELAMDTACEGKALRAPGYIE